MKKLTETACGKNFTAIDVGSFDSLSDYSVVHPRTGNLLHKVFLKEPTFMTGTEISLQSIPPHSGIPYLHTHKKNEETWIVLRGSGLMEIDGDRFPVSEGLFVRIASAGMRGLANDSDEELIVMIIQSREDSLEEYSSADGTPYPYQWEGI